jgi:hypothetical protein
MFVHKQKRLRVHKIGHKLFVETSGANPGFFLDSGQNLSGHPEPYSEARLMRFAFLPAVNALSRHFFNQPFPIGHTEVYRRALPEEVSPHGASLYVQQRSLAA